MPYSDFVHLHLHTQYSLGDGAIRIPEAIAKAKEYRMPALAITDHGNLFGAMEFYSTAEASGIKPIIGCEVYVAPGSRFTQPTKHVEPHSHHLILVCENETGYRNLCRLVTKGYQEGLYENKPRIDAELLQEYNDGLVCLSSCLKGEIAKLILADDDKGAEEKTAWYRDVFDDGRYFLEIQKNGLDEQRKVNRGVLRLAERRGIPLVATNNCHYLEQSGHRMHEILMRIEAGTKINDPNLRFHSDQLYLKSSEQMAYDFRDVPDAIRNTMAVSERCSVILESGEPNIPRFDPGTGATLDELLDKDARAGLVARLNRLLQGGHINYVAAQKYMRRLDHEIHTIQNMGFSGYFLIVADFVRFARSNGIPVGPGRGSTPGSLAAYCLGITAIDPIRHNLVFERFINPERRVMPYMAVDFGAEGRKRVIDYVSEKYGKDYVAEIIAFWRVPAKTLVTNTARALGFTHAQGDEIANLIPDYLMDTIDLAIEEEPRLRETAKRSTEVADLISTARSLERITLQACADAEGIVMSDSPLVERLPLYVGNKGQTLTQYDQTWVNKAGLVTFGFRGLEILPVIDKAVRFIEKSRGVKLDMASLPLDDHESFELLSRGDTQGIFPLESPGIREALTRFKPSTFADLTAIMSLYRPGPLESGMAEDLINRKHCLTAIEYPVPELEPILRETYGLIIYEEQVMGIATALACYTLAEADLLRRAMGRRIDSEMAEQKSRFVKGAARNKIDPEKAAHIFELVTNYSGYAFSKAHSTAYATITYQTAYLKTHYKHEFMAAHLS
jgi:DNA polymerase III subunit alpha